MSNKVIAQFAKLFCGYEHAHGQHLLELKPDEHGKIKGKAVTKGTGPTSKEYEAHLMGSGTSLGIIPLRADDHCWFAAMDIDIKGVVHLNETPEALEKRVRAMELPLVVCKSKSGGAHLYIFGSEPIPAKLIQAKLIQYAANLGYGGTEVFPKQVMRVNEQDRGNWINIAYYGALSKEGTTRYAIRNGKPILKLEDFITYAEDMRISAKELSAADIKLKDDFNDGPPCLQYINTYGLEAGGRNSALLNAGVYFKKAHENGWEELVSKFNMEVFNPPLPYNEVSQVIANLGRKPYFYTCKQPPICNHCNKKVCLTRKFGIGHGVSDGELFPIDSLTQCIAKDSVRWYANHQDQRVELKGEDLLSVSRLQLAFLNKFKTVVMPPKSHDWQVRLKELVDNADVVVDPDDASPQGQFENLLDSFFTNSRPARNRDELIKGNSYLEDARIHFRSEDLFNYLGVRRFNHSPHEVWMWLKQLGAQDKQMRVKGKMLRVWTLPEPEKFDGSMIDLPKEMEEEL